ncbi:MAG: hypothetical protein ABMA25_28840 [Ilumatobacteraceae bacterium]
MIDALVVDRENAGVDRRLSGPSAQTGSAELSIGSHPMLAAEHRKDFWSQVVHELPHRVE